MSRFQILALSGGGYKGLFTAKILENIEEKFGCPVAQKFDLLSGTSIGGILAIALALEIPAKDMSNLFLEHGKIIFTPNKLGKAGIFKSKYSNEGLKKILEEIFEDKTIADLKHRLIVPSINYTKGGPQVFKTRHHSAFTEDSNRKLVDIALATSAAPTFFPIYGTAYGDFVDGGLTANHPGFFACIEAQKFLDVELSDIYQLHVGTLSGKYTSSGKKGIMKSGLLQWKTKLIELIFSCQEQSTDQIVRFLLEDRYLSIDHDVTDKQVRSVGLDKVTRTSKRLLNQCAAIASQKYLGTNEFNKFVNHSKEQFKPIPFEGDI